MFNPQSRHVKARQLRRKNSRSGVRTIDGAQNLFSRSLLSLPRRRESSILRLFWTPAPVRLGRVRGSDNPSALISNLLIRGQVVRACQAVFGQPRTGGRVRHGARAKQDRPRGSSHLAPGALNLFHHALSLSTCSRKALEGGERVTPSGTTMIVSM